jgi:hypothetical protein
MPVLRKAPGREAREFAWLRALVRQQISRPAVRSSAWRRRLAPGAAEARACRRRARRGSTARAAGIVDRESAPRVSVAGPHSATGLAQPQLGHTAAVHRQALQRTAAANGAPRVSCQRNAPPASATIPIARGFARDPALDRQRRLPFAVRRRTRIARRRIEPPKRSCPAAPRRLRWRSQRALADDSVSCAAASSERGDDLCPSRPPPAPNSRTSSPSAAPTARRHGRGSHQTTAIVRCGMKSPRRKMAPAM